MSAKRIKQLEQALEPFARYAKYLEDNPFMDCLPDDTPLFGLPLAPTIGDLKKALTALPQKPLRFEIPKLRRATSGTKPPLI